MRDPDWALLVDETAERFAVCGTHHREFVRGKLRYDPVYRDLLGRLQGSLDATILDLGCGRGIALALLDTARRRRAPASQRPSWIGVDLSARSVDVARTVLEHVARIEQADLATWAPAGADVVLLIDVLHYLTPAAQERILAGLADALRPGARLFVRVANRGDGWRFRVTRVVDRIRVLGTGGWRQKFHFRSGTEWAEMLDSFGFEGRTSPASRGTPFDNLLIECQRTARAPSIVKIEGSTAPGSASTTSTTSGRD